MEHHRQRGRQLPHAKNETAPEFGNQSRARKRIGGSRLRSARLNGANPCLLEPKDRWLKWMGTG